MIITNSAITSARREVEAYVRLMNSFGASIGAKANAIFTFWKLLKSMAGDRCDLFLFQTDKAIGSGSTAYSILMDTATLTNIAIWEANGVQIPAQNWQANITFDNAFGGNTTLPVPCSLGIRTTTTSAGAANLFFGNLGSAHWNGAKGFALTNTGKIYADSGDFQAYIIDFAQATARLSNSAAGSLGPTGGIACVDGSTAANATSATGTPITDMPSSGSYSPSKLTIRNGSAVMEVALAYYTKTLLSSTQLEVLANAAETLATA